VAEVKLETGSLKVGDEIMVTGPSTGVYQTIVEEIRVELDPVAEAKKGVYCSIPFKEKLRRSDKLTRIISSS